MSAPVIDASSTIDPSLVGDENVALPASRNLSSRDVFRLVARAWPFIRPYKRHLFYLLLIIVPGLPVGLLGLTVIRIFFDVVGHGDALGPWEALLLRVPIDAPRQVVLLHACVLTGIVALIAMPMAALTLGYAVWILQRISNLFRVNLYTRLQELSVQFHSQEKIGDAIYRMFQDSAAIPNVIDGLVMQPLRGVPFAIANLGWLFLYDYPMALIALALIPANWLVAWIFAAPLRSAFVAEREAAALATTRIEETLASIKAVKAFGCEALEAENYARDNWNSFVAARRARMMLATYRVVTNTIRGVAYVGALYFGARAVMLGGTSGFARAAISLGAFQGTLAVFNRMSSQTRALTDRWGSMQDVAVAISRVLEMLAKPSEERRSLGNKTPRALHSSLEFERVTFGYDSRAPILQEASFVARVGEITAIAGASGEGKSTIIAMIVRFFDPSAGRIILDGEDISLFELAAWRGMISVALQENPMFSATLRDNLAYGRPDATEAELLEAIVRSGLADFVSSLPAGLDTMLGEKGAKISTGQAQRIGVARALLRDASILLLDEPTSALDAVAEDTVLDGVREWINAAPGRRLAIIATHRRTTAARANRSYEISSGQLIESHIPVAEMPASSEFPSA
ncbi:MAG: transporter related [Candidatus Binatus sp.]|nr:transporter related [Candidatus Binatus sp.]